ncbi:MAG TPA: extracellular solute-binding protein [Planctomycetaceae bacterium]|nr:extracellular solute-binding protein [Planctomycetaceae bacterium]
MNLRRLGVLGCLGLCAALSLMAIPGCEDKPEKPHAPAHPFAGQTVTVAFPAAYGFGDSWKAALDEWGEQTGAKCNLAEYKRGAEGLKELPAADVVVLSYVDLPAVASGDRLARIPESSEVGEVSAGWNDFFPGIRDRVLTISGRPTLIPISCPALVCYLRGDLLSKAGLKPPATWDDYQALLESLPNWAPGLTAVEPWGEDFRATLFLARALPYVKKPGNYSVYFDIDTGAPLIDLPGFVRALSQSVAQFAKLSPESIKLSPADCRRLVLTGKAAMAIGLEPGRSDEKPIERAPGVSLVFARLPGVRQVYDRHAKDWEKLPDDEVNHATLAPVGGLVMAVPKATPAERAEAAWNLVNFLSGDRFQQALATVPKSVARESQLSKAVDWFGSDLRTDEMYGYLAVTSESLRTTNLSPELPVIGRTELRISLTEGITSALEGKATPDAALKEVADRWRAIAAGFGVERMRDSYRACLGLSPVLKLPDLPLPQN